jgi:hypothetical protein
MGLGVDRVDKRLAKLGLPRIRKPIPPIPDDQLVAIIEAEHLIKGRTFKDLGKSLKVPVFRIKHLATMHGISRRTHKRRWTERERLLVIQRLQEGISIDGIAAEIRRTPDVIASRCRTHHIPHGKRYPQVIAYENERRWGKYSLERALKQRLVSSLDRRDKHGFEHNIDLDYLRTLYHKQDGKCYYTGTELTFRPNESATLSLDRVDSTRGYVKGNLVFCTWEVNSMKQDMSMDRFIELCSILHERWAGIKEVESVVAPT